MSTHLHQGFDADIMQRFNKLVEKLPMAARIKMGPQFQWLAPASTTSVPRRNLASAIQTVSRTDFTDLPRLPVPQLDVTLNKLLISAKPFLTPSEYATTESLVCEFKNGDGSKLQKCLEEKAKNTENWLADYWLNSAYLGFREPVMCWSSPALVYPTAFFESDVQWLQYASKMVYAALQFKQLCDLGFNPVEKIGKSIMDMQQYKVIFGTIRRPKEFYDEQQFYSNSTHIIVFYKNKPYKVPVYGNTPDNTIAILSQEQIFNQLAKCIQSEEIGPPVGVMTMTNRDVWAKSYQNLIKNETNRATVDEIEKSLFTLGMDNPIPFVYGVDDLTRAAELCVHGGFSNNSGNRWFDKTIQFTVSHNGLNGLTYEHSPAEGGPIAMMTDYILSFIKSNVRDISSICKVEPVRELKWDLSEESHTELELACCLTEKLINNLELNHLYFTEYGTNFIKSQKMSPDSFIQQVLQLAFFKVHNVPAAQYESAQTRRFLAGRTETIRSCTSELVQFTRAMTGQDKVSDEEKVKLLRTAVDRHRQIVTDASNGQGIDRHMLGLKLMAVENGMNIHPLYSDKGVKESANFRISSSQVASKNDAFMVYGPIVMNGYGACYNPQGDHIIIGISCMRECPETSAVAYKEALRDSFREIKELLVKTGGVKAKL